MSDNKFIEGFKETNSTLKYISSDLESSLGSSYLCWCQKRASVGDGMHVGDSQIAVNVGWIHIVQMPDKSETQIVQQKMNLKEVVDPEGNSLRDGYI